MIRAVLVILSLLIPATVLAAPQAVPTLELGGTQQRAAGGRVSSPAEANLPRELGVSSNDIPDLADIDAQTAESFELKLPEEDLPDSDIPLTFNKKVDYFVRYFQTSGRAAFARWLSRSERFIPMMREVLRKEGMPEDLVYLAMIESGFSPHALSVASAVGPWQFMSGTGKRYALRIDYWIDERRDPLKSTVAAALYLKELYALFNQDWYLAAAGYNAGENKILRAISKYNSRDFWEISKGEYLARETKDYVPKLLAAAIIAKEPAKYGFADVAYLPPIEFDRVKIPSRTDLEVVAKLCNVSLQSIRELNPELRHATTPPRYPDYELKIPKGTAAQFQAKYAQLAESQRYKERVRHVAYRAKRKDTLVSIAKRFKSSPQTIAELNNIGRRTKSLHGRVLTIPVLISSDYEPVEAKQPETQAVAKQEPAAAKHAGWFLKYYTVKKGDTLASLARRFNVTQRVLSAWNNLKTKVALKPGKRLIVARYQEKKGAMVKDSG